LPTAALAQNGPPTFVVRDDAVVIMHLDDVPGLLASLEATSLGRLLADPDVAAACRIGAERLHKRRLRTTLLARAARAEQLQLEAWYRNDLADDLFWEIFQQLDPLDVRSFAIGGVTTADRFRLTTAGYLRVHPRAEGRCTRLFDLAAMEMRKDANLVAVEGAKFEGFPVHAFTPSDSDTNGMPPGYARLGPWMLHLPGTFAFGEGMPEQCGRLANAPQASPGVGLRIDLTAYLQQFTGQGMPLPAELQIFGIDKIASFTWTGRFEDGHVLDTMALSFADAPTGLLPCLWNGKAPLPKQALPDGGLMQLRLSVDVPELIRTLGQVVPGGLPAPLADGLQKVLRGGVALAVVAPAQGGYIPRLYATFDLADAEALAPLLQFVLPPVQKSRQITYDGVACTALQFEDLPPGLQPTWCVLDGRLHVAETPQSLRAFLKAQKGDGDGIDTSGAPSLAKPAGELVPGFDLRADLGAVYRSFHETWLPLLELTMAQGSRDQSSLVTRSELPDPDDLAPLLGTVRGELRRTGNEVRLQCLGPLGGPFAAAFALTYGPILSESIHRDYATELYDQELSKRRLETLWTALQAFQQQHQRWPKDLAELVVDRKLAADALLVPGDEKAELVPMPAGTLGEVRSSFTFHPDGATMAVNGQDQKVLLSRKQTRYGGRVVLSLDGTIGEVYGDIFQTVEVGVPVQVEVVEPAESR
ncbi:MAG: hypothetical protein JNL12_21265, partial [Planctomycetes bacterium]|nr:hypothetical protein [Planctomycetota bacterium]